MPSVHETAYALERSDSILPGASGTDAQIGAAVLSELAAFIAEHGVRRKAKVKAELELGPYKELLDKPLPRLPRAVALDVYGTLLSGAQAEPGTADLGQPGASLSSGLRYPPNMADRLRSLVSREHAKARLAGIPWPEVDAVALFMEAQGLGPDEGARACVAWECINNPCAPIQGVPAFFDSLKERAMALGIVSNAQFYTPLFMEAVYERPLYGPDGMGVDPALSFWSYRTGRAKPDSYMYERLAEKLARRGIAPSETVYIGNDALNDCAAAAAAGFMTVLFAGDARSYQARLGEGRLAVPVADSVVSSWQSALKIVTDT